MVIQLTSKAIHMDSIFDGLYSINQTGDVKNVSTGRIIKHDIGYSGYHRVSLFARGRSRKYFVHRLVAIAFIPNLHNKPFINHKNGNKSDNNIDNLEWVTNMENMRHSFENRLRPSGPCPKTGLSHPRARKVQCLATGRTMNFTNAAKECGLTKAGFRALMIGVAPNWTHFMLHY